MKVKINIFDDIEKLKTIRKVFVFGSLVFLGIGVIFWVVLFVLIFGIHFLYWDCEYSLFYYLAIVAITIAFGLLTAVFSINTMIDKNNKDRIEERDDVVSIYQSFNQIVQLSEYSFIKMIIDNIPASLDFSSIRSNYEICFEVKHAVDEYYKQNIDSDLIISEITALIKKSIITGAESPTDDYCKSYFKSVFESVFDSFEGISFKILNQPSIELDKFVPCETIKNLFLNSLYFIDSFNLSGKYTYVILITNKALGKKDAVVSFEGGKNED